MSLSTARTFSVEKTWYLNNRVSAQVYFTKDVIIDNDENISKDANNTKTVVVLVRKNIQKEKSFLVTVFNVLEILAIEFTMLKFLAFEIYDV